MACSNYCSKNDFSQFSSSLGYGSRAKWGTATLSVTSERTLAYSLEKGKERYEVSLEANVTSAEVDGKTVETKATEFIRDAQKPEAKVQSSKETHHEASVLVSSTDVHVKPVGNPSGDVVTAMIAAAFIFAKASNSIPEPVRMFCEGLTITIKARRVTKK